MGELPCAAAFPCYQTIGEAARRRVRSTLPAAMAFSLVMAACALTACGSARDGLALAFVDPGTIVYLNCDQLADANKAQTARKRDLEELIRKASSSTMGS